MDYFIENKCQVGVVEIPASKSYAQRAILAASLSRKRTHIINTGSSDDVRNIIGIAKQIGASVSQSNGDVFITGFVNKSNRELNVGESGLGIRLTTSICAILKGNFHLTGEGSLVKRSMAEFEHFLPQLGIKCSLNNGFLPIELNGEAVPGIIHLDGRISSQYLSGLLMALPLLDGNSTVIVDRLKSKPYIDITLDVLKSFGIAISNDSYRHFKISGNQTYQCDDTYIVEGDYSGASIWMVHGALKAGVQIRGLKKKTEQGDQKILDALSQANVSFKWMNEELIVEKSAVSPFEFDANECPDLFPALVVLAAGAKGTSKISGVQRLLHKESNRALVLQKEFAKLGLVIELDKDHMYVHGTGNLKSGEVDSNDDHRIAMAGAIAASLTTEGITITSAESVNKSYPNFWKHFKSPQ